MHCLQRRHGMLWLDGDALADARRVDVFTHRRDPARQFVTEDHRLLDDEVTDPAVAVVVHVRTAHPDRRNLDQNLVGSRCGDGALFDLQRTDARHHARAHRGRRGGRLPVISLPFVRGVNRARPTTIWLDAGGRAQRRDFLGDPAVDGHRQSGESRGAGGHDVESVQLGAVAGAGFDEHDEHAVGCGRPLRVVSAVPFPPQHEPRRAPARPDGMGPLVGEGRPRQEHDTGPQRQDLRQHGVDEVGRTDQVNADRGPVHGGRDHLQLRQAHSGAAIPRTRPSRRRGRPARRRPTRGRRTSREPVAA